MVRIRKETKTGRRWIAIASQNKGTCLSDVYVRWSQKKQVAYDSCREMCFYENGTNFRIISHNIYGFSVAWETKHGTRIETPKNSYLIFND